MRANTILGQHFLVNKHIIKIICDSIGQDTTNLLEIGPGTGNLTEQIYKTFKGKITILEKDYRFIESLNNKYGKFINIEHNDCLEFNQYDQFDIIVSNLPYNIGQKLIMKLLLYPKLFTMIFMLQKEVAQKFLHNSFMSCITYFNYDVQLICDVNKDAFTPKPNVLSQVIKFTPKNTQYMEFSKLLPIIRNLYNNPKRKLKNRMPNFAQYRIHQLPIEDIYTFLLQHPILNK